MLEKKNNLKAWLYLAPALILMSIFTFYPLINTFGISFLEKFIMPGVNDGFGFGNYLLVVKDAQFIQGFKNTIIIVGVTVPISTGLALLIALGLNSIKKFKKVYQTIFFIPYVTNAIAVGMVFAVMFNNNYGIVNEVLGWFGIDAVAWIGNGAAYSKSMFVLLVYIIWSSLPFKILILLGGLQGVDKQYYQAAQIDNASKIKTFFRITVPLLSPILAYVFITSFIGAFKEYSTIIAIFGDAAGDTLRGQFGTIVWYIYNELNSVNGGRGTAAAAAVILLCIILVITGINMYISKKKVHY